MTFYRLCAGLKIKLANKDFPCYCFNAILDIYWWFDTLGVN